LEWTGDEISITRTGGPTKTKQVPKKRNETKRAARRTLQEISNLAHGNKVTEMRLAGCGGSPVNLWVLSFLEHGFELFLADPFLEVTSHEMEFLLPSLIGCWLHGLSWSFFEDFVVSVREHTGSGLCCDQEAIFRRLGEAGLPRVLEPGESIFRTETDFV
jgi:hypothetical protein